MSINWWTDKPSVVFSYNGLYVSHKKEWPADGAATWMNLENIMPSQKSQVQKATYRLIPLIWSIQNRQIHGYRKQTGGCQGPQGAREEGMGSDC